MADADREFPAVVLSSTVWRRVLDDKAYEHCSVKQVGGGLVVCGSIVAVSGDAPALCHYELTCSADLDQAFALTLTCAHRGREPSLRLRRSAAASWLVDDLPAAQLDGCTDIDIEWTPATNLLPIRRLAAAPGSVLDVTAAWVRLPGLAIEPTHQRYERIAADRVRYTNVPSGFTAILTVDPRGMPVDYEGIWIRTGRWSVEP
ncbi:putative glycolipid-binding domain-containing protein [Phreatobacter stygius]|uniref:putative glycolipid-binding domain-containing protein n=1 Tax=Phreatobacter stygius TaxID=1940610 RepID=UPI001477676D|nr:putative glycolipid-binding domain-containing protein [Phreatobacter stygius]